VLILRTVYLFTYMYMCDKLLYTPLDTEQAKDTREKCFTCVVWCVCS